MSTETGVGRPKTYLGPGQEPRQALGRTTRKHRGEGGTGEGRKTHDSRSKSIEQTQKKQHTKGGGVRCRSKEKAWQREMSRRTKGEGLVSRKKREGARE